MQLSSSRLRKLVLPLIPVLIITLLAPALGANPAKKAGAQTLTSKHEIQAPETGERNYMPNELVVKFKPSAKFSIEGSAPEVGTLDLAQALSCFDLTTAKNVLPSTYKLSGGSVDVKAAAAALEASGAVEFAEPNYIRHIMRTPNDEQYTNQQQWGITQIHAEEAWDITTGNDNIVIAIVDTGTARNHPDLEGKVIDGWDFVNNDGDPSDDFGHGTYTAGIAAAASNNGRGVVGVAWGAKVMPIKVLSSRGSGSDSDIAQGIHWAVDHGAKIINASLGGDEDTRVQKEAAQYAFDRNVLFVASAGNTPDGRPNYPAGYSTVLAVGATGRSDTYTGFSSFGGYVGVSAPGVGILSTVWDGDNLGYEYGNGTSASAPFVSGLAALVWSANPNLTAQEVRQIIEDSTDDLGDPGRDEHYGYGRVNALRAVQFAQQGPRPTYTPGPPTVPPGTPNIESTKAPVNTSIKVSTTNVAPGQLVTILGVGFGPNEQVDLHVSGGGKDEGIGNATTNANGEFQAEAAMPKDLAAGSATLTASGVTSGKKASVDLTVKGGGGNGGQSRIHGKLQGGAMTGANVSLKPVLGTAGQEITTQPGADNTYTFDGVTVGVYELRASAPNYLPAGPYMVEVDGTPNDVKSVDIMLNSTIPAAISKVPSVPNSPTQVYFNPVGHTLKGPFLKFWQSHGGLAIFGYPISEEFTELSQTDGKLYTVQYFERNRFEYHPEFAGTPNEVLMGLLGVDSTRARTFPPGKPVAGDPNNTAYFNETLHSLTGPFLKYWQQHGGLAIFGYPISEPMSENGYLVQYFQRNRFEYHPEYAGTPNEVLLGLLGVETVQRNGWIQP